LGRRVSSTTRVLARALDKGSVTYETILEEVSQDHMSNFGSQTLNHLAKHHSENFSNKGPHVCLGHKVSSKRGGGSWWSLVKRHLCHVMMSQPTTFDTTHSTAMGSTRGMCTGYHEGGSVPFPPSPQLPVETTLLVSWCNPLVGQTHRSEYCPRSYSQLVLNILVG